MTADPSTHHPVLESFPENSAHVGLRLSTTLDKVFVIEGISSQR